MGFDSRVNREDGGPSSETAACIDIVAIRDFAGVPGFSDCAAGGGYLSIPRNHETLPRLRLHGRPRLAGIRLDS